MSAFLKPLPLPPHSHPFLSPVVLRTNPDSYRRVEGADLYDNVELRTVVALTDGGVYDNLGLQTLTGPRFKTVLVSDASGGLTIIAGTFGFWGSQVMRALDTATSQARGLRRIMTIESAQQEGRRLAIWRTLTNPGDYPAQCPFDVHPDWRLAMAAIRTRLNHFRQEERARLINWGYVLSDLALRSYVDLDAELARELPYPRSSFEADPGTGHEDVAGELDGGDV